MSSYSMKRPRLAVNFKAQPSLLQLIEDTNTSHGGGYSRWGRLPLELIVQVCSYLTSRDKTNLFLVCSNWSAAANVSSLWRYSWISLKPTLISHPIEFWNIFKLRCIDKIFLYQNGKNFLTNLVSLHHNIPHLYGLGVEFLSKVEHDDIWRIAKFQQLVELKLSFKQFTPMKFISGLNLKDLTNLKKLLISGATDVGNCDMSFLSHPSLSYFSLEACGSLKDIDTNSFMIYFPNLHTLEIKGCIYYHPFVAYAKALNNCKLKELNMTRSSFNGASSPIPTWLQSITRLNLCFCRQNHSQLVNFLSQLSELEYLNLKGNLFSDETIKCLISSNLIHVDLSMNHDITVQSLYNLSLISGASIRHLMLSYCSKLMSRDRTAILNSLNGLFPNLISLNLCGWNTSQKEIVNLLVQCPTLQRITVDRTYITNRTKTDIYNQTKYKTIIATV